MNKENTDIDEIKEKIKNTLKFASDNFDILFDSQDPTLLISGLLQSITRKFNLIIMEIHDKELYEKTIKSQYKKTSLWLNFVKKLTEEEKSLFSLQLY